MHWSACCSGFCYTMTCMPWGGAARLTPSIQIPGEGFSILVRLDLVLSTWIHLSTDFPFPSSDDSSEKATVQWPTTTTYTVSCTPYINILHRLMIMCFVILNICKTLLYIFSVNFNINIWKKNLNLYYDFYLAISFGLLWY